MRVVPLGHGAAWWLVCWMLAFGGAAAAAEPEDETPAMLPLVAQEAVDRVVEKARPALAVISYTGRDGRQQGLGTGFVVRSDGLVATNLHVIGEARPIQVTIGKQPYPVVAVHASDRQLDLAVLRIEAKDLPALELGDSSQLKSGQPVVAMGNPLGLENSVVTGVVSGLRDIDDRRMIQLAIPIEPGNSGGPVLDLDGKVHGIITIKSLRTANLGFAMPSRDLKSLLDKPNPVPIARWLTIGGLDEREWEAVHGGQWRQRAGQIVGEGMGEGFGGRTLCLSRQAVPQPPYEVAVMVKLDDESGAAGLAFEADGGDKHFGFYPSGGKLRLTDFQGPTVYSWKILHEEASRHYRPGEWNHLKVRVEENRVQCFVNDALVVQQPIAAPRHGRVGLAKFRNTRAQFKRFRVAKELPPSEVSPQRAEQILAAVKDLQPEGGLPDETIEELAPLSDDAQVVLRRRAAALRRQADLLERVAHSAHHRRVQQQLADVLDQGEEKADLWHAALLVALLDNDELQIDAYRQQLEHMAEEIRETLPADAGEADRLAALNKYLFEDNGFHGSRADYYHRANSYVNQVLEDREGLPITLSVLYIELAARLGLQVEGVGLPGHFVVRYRPREGAAQLIDVYDLAKPLSDDEARKKIRELGIEPTEEHFQAATKRAIVVRMLHNLRGLAERSGEPSAGLHYVDTILALTPDDSQMRWYRAVVRFQARQFDGARRDVNWLLEREPADIDLERVRQLEALLDQTQLQ